jgi:hypothetical protein
MLGSGRGVASETVRRPELRSPMLECYTSECQEVADGHNRITIIEFDTSGGSQPPRWLR